MLEEQRMQREQQLEERTLQREQQLEQQKMQLEEKILEEHRLQREEQRMHGELDERKWKGEMELKQVRKLTVIVRL